MTTDIKIKQVLTLYEQSKTGSLDKDTFHFLAEQMIEISNQILPELISHLFVLNQQFSYGLEHNPNLFKWAFINNNTIIYQLVNEHMLNKPIDAALTAAITNYSYQGVEFLAQHYPEQTFVEKHFVCAMMRYFLALDHENQIIKFYLKNLNKIKDLSEFSEDKIKSVINTHSMLTDNEATDVLAEIKIVRQYQAFNGKILPNQTTQPTIKKI